MINQFIPIDKSRAIRYGVLDMLAGGHLVRSVLSGNYCDLSDDLKVLLLASYQWEADAPYINVGESATLLRCLKFACWKLRRRTGFVADGSLQKREVCDNSEIIRLPISELLKLDHGTTQWATAAALAGSGMKERIPDPPPKLAFTYEIIDRWVQAGIVPGDLMRKDDTIMRQATVYLNYLGTGKVEFKPLHSEDYCFARALGVIRLAGDGVSTISISEASKRWPSLQGHESDRIKEMEDALNEIADSKPVSSKDHRVVQAVVMRTGGAAKVLYPQCVTKSWPRFWEFIDFCCRTNEPVR